MSPSNFSRRSLRLPAVLAVSIALALNAPLYAAAQSSVASGSTQRTAFDIPAQSLDSALTRLADQGGVRILFVSNDVSGLQGTAIKGQLSAAQALDQLLAGSGLAWQWREPGTAVVTRSGAATAGASTPLVTGTLSVTGQQGIEATGAQRDLRGQDEVYDLDLSTAYLGRTEIERYKGATPSDLLNGVAGVFSGDARNSGALDVNIRGVQGPGRVPVTIDGTEQAVTAWRGYNGIGNRNYVDPNLIGGMQIFKGPSLTRNVTTGIGGGVVIKTLDVDDVVPEGESFGGEFKIEGSSNAVAPRLPGRLYTGMNHRDVPELATGSPTNDPTLRVQPHTGGGGYNVFDGEDHAYRLALGWKSDTLSLFGAYAYRDRGNYFAGKRGAGYYSQPVENIGAGDYIITMANRLRPGDEVTNTSSQMESWLFKATWNPTPDQVLRFGYRDTLSHYGEIMPSRINRTALGLPQWSLSRVDSTAYNLEYKWQPQDSRWIDLYANLWRTDTDSNANTAGSYPNYWNAVTQPIIMNGALDDSTNTRNGLTLSNLFRLSDTLDLTVGGDFQHEKLRSHDEYIGPSAAWRMFPRAGRREEWNANFNLEWRPVDFLKINAGARYSSYWAYDDFLADHPNTFLASVSGYQATYRTMSAEERSKAETQARTVYQVCATMPFYCDLFGIPAGISEAEYVASKIHEAAKSNTIQWLPDAEGKFHRVDNPCTNGMLNGIADLYEGGNCSIGLTANPIASRYAVAKKRRDRGWAPSLTVTGFFSDYSRAYFSYNEALRYPNMFESVIAFGASVSPFRDLKPEHTYSYELGYIQELGHLLGNDTIADVKLSYYHRRTDDLIERDNNFLFRNIEKQLVQGVEFQGRYDNGRFFTDLAVAHTLKNEVCDEHTSITIDPNVNGTPTCVDQGFIGSWLLTQASPETSANWSLAGRFLDKRLELGTRVVYYQRRKPNRDLEAFADVTNQNLAVFNVPFSWDTTWLFDAYASYRVNDTVQLELIGTNLSDRYYADPATRSLLPAPGRTLKLSVTARF